MVINMDIPELVIIKMQNLGNLIFIIIFLCADYSIIFDLLSLNLLFSASSADSAPIFPLKSRGNRHSRIIDAINQLENERNKKLQMSHIIGYKTDRMADLNLGIRVRRVNFRWQRGIKIGQFIFFPFLSFFLSLFVEFLSRHLEINKWT